MRWSATSGRGAALIDELGIEPGPALKELERAILAHDPGARGARPPVRATDTRARRGGPLIAAGGAVLLAAIALVAVMLSKARSTLRSRRTRWRRSTPGPTARGA